MVILQLIDKDVHHIYEINTLKVKVMGDRQCFPKFTFSGLGFSDPRSHTFTWTFPFKTPNEHTFTWRFPYNHPVNTLSRGTFPLKPSEHTFTWHFPFKPPSEHTFTWHFPFKPPSEHTFTWHFPFKTQ